MEFDRFDIVEGYYWFYSDYHGGQGSVEYSRLCRISRYLKPGILASGPSSEYACMVYNDLEEKHGYAVTPYEALESGEVRLIRD